MKLYLTSVAANMLDEIDFSKHRKVAFIPNAGDLYENPSFVAADRAALVEKGLEVEDLDLKEYHSGGIREKLKEYEVIFVAGGNTFYLMQQVLKSGFGRALQQMIYEDKLYIGSSAGSVIACPDIDFVKKLDDPSAAELPNHQGLHLINFYVLPHFEVNETNVAILGLLRGEEVITLPDNQMVVYCDGNKKIVTAKH
ncbi:Type 1 glutamine amidotransferase-like domain-containing protein [Candidatus Woesearchaeota archaeon]|nr:Type 1 glutamine amidotransferase-like domain-containing protein [Candidatus Woesearchaeota archaeon]